ncbi:FHA domain-containing protein [Paenibacillus oenotherae]|uniref:FHA domain-containing protein n=1 Tax=Paenibacillus oenotherae TaxID=1435645 RepID=A0ABS7D9C6_9BACL|nr:DUF6382 domain-containing protein [Paenibacillus oenotherae]MBW7476554.1 FHA domain-containing protein [Paenibacillus oenotherae]
MISAGFRIDFSMKRGHEMVVDRPSGILREELEEVEIAMLQSQHIPRVLDMEWVGIDGAVTFRYSLSGKRMLSHRLQMVQLTMIDFYALLLAVIEVIDDCEQYLLREEGFMLHEQYMFVGEQWDDIGLVYIPLKGGGAVPAPSEAVMAMAVRWISYVARPDGMGLQSVFQHLREDRVSWGGLRQSLLTLLGSADASFLSQEPGIHQQTPFSQKRDRVPSISQCSDNDQTVARLRVEDGCHTGLDWESDTSNDRLMKVQNSESEDDALPELQTLSGPSSVVLSRSKKAVCAIVVIAVGLIWKFLYMDSPTQPGLYVSAGLTLMAAAGLLFYWRRMTGDQGVEDAPSFDANFSQYEDSWREEGAGYGSNKHLGRTEEVVSESPVSMSPSQNVPFRNGGSDATALLGSESKDMQGYGNVIPWLARNVGGTIERVALLKRNIIGRAEEGATYVDRSPGVSRAHLELSDDNGSWIVKDMGSRNGSTLNGETMIPYKSYSLTNGDVMQLAGDKGPQYEFRAG